MHKFKKRLARWIASLGIGITATACAALGSAPQSVDDMQRDLAAALRECPSEKQIRALQLFSNGAELARDGKHVEAQRYFLEALQLARSCSGG